MIIRCPHCEHTRSISEGKIPPQAEYATCPKCRHRFLFRSLPRDVEAGSAPSSAEASAAARQARKLSGEDRHVPQPQTPGPEVLRPQEAFRESEEQRDIWDAMDALHQRWEAQLDQQVTEVEQPRLAKAEADAESFFPPDSPSGAGPERSGAAPASAAPQPPATPPLPESARQPAAPASGPPLSLTPPQSPARTQGQMQAQAPGRTQERAPAPPPRTEPQSAPQSVPRTEQEQVPVPAPQAVPAAAAMAGQSRTDAASSAPPPASDLALTPEHAPGAPDVAPELDPEVRDPDLNAKAARPRFPTYGEGGPDPEERVEKDMEMLRAASAPGSTRDLGRLREFADAAQAPEAGTEEDGDLLHLPLPEAAPDPATTGEQPAPAWEHPRGSRLAAFNATVRGVMFGGPGYFSGMSGSGSLVPGYLFFLLMGYICIICSLAWRGLAEFLLPGLLPPFPRGLVLPALLLLAPAALGLMQLFVTGWIRLLLRLLVPDQADFGLVYKVVSYSVSPFVLSIVPFAGPLLGAAWFMASLTSGCRGALRLSLPLSILLPLPPAALLLAALAWYFL